MPRPPYPALLSAAAWLRQKDLDDDARAFGESLKRLAKLHDAIDAPAFDAGGAKELRAAAAALAALDGAVRKSVQAFGGQAGALATQARALQAGAKKSGAVSRTVAAQAGKVAEAALEHVDTLEKALQAARAALEARLDELRAEDDTAEADAPGAAQLEKMGRRVLAALRLLRRAEPGSQPMRFLVAAGVTHTLMDMSPSLGGSQREKMKKLLPADEALRFFAGECRFEDAAWVFVGPGLPGGGFARRLQATLLAQTGLRCRVRVMRPDGQREEAEEADAAAGGVPNAALLEAQRAWAAARVQAVAGIGQFADHLAELYRDDAGQRGAVAAARGRLLALRDRLQPELEALLARAAAETDAARREPLLRAARQSLTGVVALVTGDPVLAELDGNELMPELRVVAPLRAGLRTIATALA